MLILKRREGQSIILYDEETDKRIAVLFISDVKGEYVKIGIDAPQSMREIRPEAKKKASSSVTYE